MTPLMALSELLERSTTQLASKRDITLFYVWVRLPLLQIFAHVVPSGFIFAGSLFGFVLARLQFLSIDIIFREGSAPGEWFWLRSGFRRVGIILHLATVLPAGFLVVFQVRPRAVQDYLMGTVSDRSHLSSYPSFATKPSSCTASTATWSFYSFYYPMLGL